MKVPVVNREHYIQYIEYFNDLHFLHTDVFKWSKEIKQEYLKDLDTLQRLLDSPLYAVVEVNNTKLSKFSNKIGFNYIEDLLGSDQQLYKIYKRSL